MHDIVVVGGSAGALEGLSVFLQGLPKTLKATVCAVLHSTESGLALVPGLLQRRSRLRIRVARDGERLERGVVYLPPADHHLMLRAGHTIVNRGPKQNRFRPAIDPLFVSAAAAYGPRVVGILLSGMLDDGVHGLADIRRAGGIVVVQDPDDAPIPMLPTNALQSVRVDHVVPAAGMGQLVDYLSGTPARKTVMSKTKTKTKNQNKMRRNTRSMQSGPTRIPKEPASGFTCPECDGALWLDTGNSPQYRCHVGHAFTPSSLLAGQRDVSDKHMWGAVRSLEEQAEMHRRFIPAGSHPDERRDFHRHAEALEQRALILRRILIERNASPGGRSNAAGAGSTGSRRRGSRSRSRKSRAGERRTS